MYQVERLRHGSVNLGLAEGRMSALIFAEDQPPTSQWVAKRTPALAEWNIHPKNQGNLGESLEDPTEFEPKTLARRKEIKLDASPVGILASLVHHSLQEGDDAYQIATDLLEVFGSVGGALYASEYALREVVKNSEVLYFVFAAARNAAIEIAKNTLDTRPILSTSEEVFNYARVRLGHENCYVCCSLYLDTNMRLLEVKELSRGTTDKVVFYPRELVKGALQQGCVNVILIHNMLLENPEITRHDNIAICQLVECLQIFGISLHDVIIVSRQSCVSLRSLGYVEGTS